MGIDLSKTHNGNIEVAGYEMSVDRHLTFKISSVRKDGIQLNGWLQAI